MRQSTNPAKIKALSAYHKHLKALFDKGELDGKVIILMKSKAKTLGLTMRTWYKAKKPHQDKLGGG